MSTTTRLCTRCSTTFTRSKKGLCAQCQGHPSLTKVTPRAHRGGVLSEKPEWQRDPIYGPISGRLWGFE
jgi:predicted amidophosphoribosyltransferase